MKIGILSDTHGLLRPQVLETLSGCDIILHAGDIDKQSILDELMTIAPVHVVRGNNDWNWARRIPLWLEIRLAGRRVFMTHKRSDIPENTADFDLVVFGHSHNFEYWQEGKTIFLNPGSCGPRRFAQPVSMAVAVIDDAGIRIRRVDIP